jgi:TIGR03009 family protein
MTRLPLFGLCCLIFVCPSFAVAQVITQPAAARPAAGAAPGQVAQPVAPAMSQPPEWTARMSVEEQKWIEQVLQYWEGRSDKVRLFECKFQRWDYDGGFVDANQRRHPRTYAEGAIKYAQPDKGLYRVEKLVSILPPANPGDKPQEVVQNPDVGEHWICDGEKVYSFEANKKQVTVTPLPPEMQGKAIADGPLPFMFGAKAPTIQARYWIHEVPASPTEKKKGKYWLEAVPKSRQDAQNFKLVRIVLDEKDFLPESLEIFAPNFNPPQNDARQTYVFSNRVVKDEATIKDMVTKGLDPFGILRRDFFDPRIPAGWRKVTQDSSANVPIGPPPPQQAGPAPPPRQPLSIPR